MPRARWARTRGRWSFALITVMIAFVTAGVTLAALIQFRGYCAADFLPINTAPAAAPYVQDVTDNAATVMWRTVDETEGMVAFGQSPETTRTVTGEKGRIHTLRLTGLEPDSAYSYRVRVDGSWTSAHTFQTPPGPDGAVTAVVVGDTGSGSAVQEQLAEVMLQLDPSLVLHTGDVVYPRGGACHYEDRFYEPYEDLLASVPIYPVLGNHDVLTDNGEPYLTAFSLPTERSGTERYYSFDYGPLHVAALDSELYYGDESITADQQKEWLRRDLRATERPWKIVVIHRPPFNSSPYHGADPRVLEDLVGIFEEEGVDVVFAGHEHVYERLKSINGITYFVTGGGGAELRGAGTSERTAVSALRYHVLRVEVGPLRMQIDAVGIDGAVFDRVELTQPASDYLPPDSSPTKPGVARVAQPWWHRRVTPGYHGSR